MRPNRTPLFAVPTALVALVLLAGCNPVAEPEPTPTETTTPSASATPTPAPTPTAEASQPITISCDELTPAQVMYDYNPNFALEAGFTPARGSLGAEAVAEKGIACSWLNLTSSQTIEITAAHLPTAALDQRKNDLITTSNSVPTYLVEGYFIVEGDVGTAQAFSGPFWITASSVTFFEPGEVAPLIAAAIAALG
jgi:hypothetical protein